MFQPGDRVQLKLSPDFTPMYWKDGDQGIVEKVVGNYVKVVMDRTTTASPVGWHPSLLEHVPKPLSASTRILPDDSAVREQFPLYDGLFAYFPAALCEVARWSKIGNDKHNPGEKLHWAREKSTDHENKILRHLLDARERDENGIPEAVALAWRALALCQTILEENGWAEGANARRLR